MDFILLRRANKQPIKRLHVDYKKIGQRPILLSFVVFIVFFVFFLATMAQEALSAGADDFSTPREGVFVKKYTRDELRKILEEPGGWFSSDEELLKQLRFAGLITERDGKSDKKERNLVDLKDFSFHKKGRFEFVRYSKDGKNLFASYMYPSKDPDSQDNKDYNPDIFNRNALTQWDASTGRLETVWLAEENSAKAVDISKDEKIAIYHVDIYGKYAARGVEVLKNQLYSHYLIKEEGGSEKIASFGYGENSYPYRTLDNIALSPDGKLIVFSGRQTTHSNFGHQYIIDMTDKKILKQFTVKYGEEAPDVNKASSMVFSPDGKQLARSFPDSVRGKYARIATHIMDTSSREAIRKLSPEESSLIFFNVMYSPDGKYLIRHLFYDKTRTEIISAVSGGLFCTIPSGGLWNNISPDGKFYLTFLPEQFMTFFLDTRTCFRLPGQIFPQSIGKQLKTVFSPDGRHIALAGETQGGNVIRIINFNKPDEKQIDIFRKAERAIELYRGGLKKEGVAMAQEVIKTNPQGFHEIDYAKRLDETGMPLFLSGELYQKAYEQASRQRNNRLGVQLEEKKEGLAVKEVYGNTPAQKAGLTRGDIITGIAGIRAVTTNQFLNTYHNLPPDYPTELAILRNGNPLYIRLTPIKGFSGYTFRILMNFALRALESGHPATAMQAIYAVKGWIREGRIYTDRGMQEQLLVVEASALASMGKEGDAFALLIRHNGFEEFGTASSIIFVRPEAFSSLLKDRRKLATALIIKESLLPHAPKKAVFPQPYPDLTGRIIGPLSTPPALGTTQPAHTSDIPATVAAPAPAGRATTIPSVLKPPSRGTVLD